MKREIEVIFKVVALFLIFTLISPSQAQAYPSGYPGKSQSMKDLNTLKVKPKVFAPTYKRSEFGPAWADVDNNNCDTRNDILHRDLFQQVTSFKYGPCEIQNGKLLDPYTNKTIIFKRGAATSSAVQIDHIVSLSDAWKTGAYLLSSTQRLNFANDPLNLLATSGPVNDQKSDFDSSQWLPENKSFYCSFGSITVAVKKKYNLWVTKSEKSALAQLISTC